MAAQLIAAGLGLVGGILGNRSKAKQASTQARYDRESADTQRRWNKEDYNTHKRELHNAEARARKEAKAASEIPTVTKQKSKTVSALDLKRLVRSAQGAGFNPLTVLRATGGNGYAVSKQSSVHSVKGPPALVGAFTTGGVQGAVAPTRQATQGFAADAFNGAVQGYRSVPNPTQVQREELEQQLIQAEIADLQRPRNSWPSSVVSIPGAVQGRQGGGAGAAGPSNLSPLWMNGERINPAPGTSNAEDFEARGGEPGGFMAGLNNVIRDGMIAPVLRSADEAFEGFIRNQWDLFRSSGADMAAGAWDRVGSPGTPNVSRSHPALRGSTPRTPHVR